MLVELQNHPCHHRMVCLCQTQGLRLFPDSASKRDRLRVDTGLFFVMVYLAVSRVVSDL